MSSRARARSSLTVPVLLLVEVRRVELGVDLDGHVAELVEVHLPVPVARHHGVLDVVGEAAVEPLVLLRVVVELGLFGVRVEARRQLYALGTAERVGDSEAGSHSPSKVPLGAAVLLQLLEQERRRLALVGVAEPLAELLDELVPGALRRLGVGKDPLHGGAAEVGRGVRDLLSAPVLHRQLVLHGAQARWGWGTMGRTYLCVVGREDVGLGLELLVKRGKEGPDLGARPAEGFGGAVEVGVVGVVGGHGGCCVLG